MKQLTAEHINSIFSAIRNLGLDRDTLLLGIPSAFTGSLKKCPDLSSQILTDIHSLNDVECLSDGSIPLRSWLENACRLSELRQEQGVFASALRYLSERTTTASSGRVQQPPPRGVYKVDASLRTSEEDRERVKVDRARVQEDAVEDCRIDPRAFYSLRAGAQWLAVFRNWDAPRSFRNQLLDLVMKRSEAPDGTLAAAIVGPGGSGKSVALRRLAVDLWGHGRDVWWIRDLAGFLQSGLTELGERSTVPQIVLLDRSDQHKGDLRLLLAQIKEYENIIPVLAGREMSGSIRWPTPGTGLFEPDESADRVAILRKIAELVPSWAQAAKQLEAEPLRRARLVRTLLVLARKSDMPKTVEKIESAFEEILSDDVLRAGTAVPGLAEAIVEAAVLRDAGVSIDHATFVALADLHRPGARVLLDEVWENERWRSVHPLMEHGAGNRWRFHHDELASGILSAANAYHRPLGNHVLVDAAWRRRTLMWIMEHGHFTTRSPALCGLVVRWPDLIPPEKAIAYLKQLMADNCQHSSYLDLALAEELRIDDTVRYELLDHIATTGPMFPHFWALAHRWLHAHRSARDRNLIATHIIDVSVQRQGGVAHSIMIVCLNMMDAHTAREHARRLVLSTPNHEVQCVCLNLLGDEAIVFARQLIQSATEQDVLCACLKLLREEAKPRARELLKSNRDHSVITTCLKILGSEAKTEAMRLLRESTDHDVLCACLRIVGIEARDDARRLLEEHPEPYLARVCLEVLGKESPDALRRVLRRPARGDVHCLALKLLGAEGRDDARRLLRESTHTALRCVCLNILGLEAKDDAHRLLYASDTPYEVRNRCLAILGDEGLPYALEQLSKWRNVHPDVVSSCLGVAWRTREGQAVAKEILENWDTAPRQLRVAALGTPSRLPVRLICAEEVLRRWTSEPRMLVAAALNAYGEKAAAVTSTCRAIISRWRDEIEWQKSRGHDRHDTHVVKAMSHPLLRNESRAAAHDMLREEAAQPGLLTQDLKECAEGAARNKFAPWAQEQRASMRRRLGASV